MELRHLHAFLTVAQEESFTRAAARLYLTQSALSQQIRELERHVGGPLFERSARWVRLTATGAALLAPARHAVDAAADALAIAKQNARSEAGRLRVGLYYGGAAELTRPILAAYRTSFPHVRLTVCRPDHSTMQTAVSAGDLDLAIVRPPIVDPGLTVSDLYEEPRVLAVSRSHLLADAGEVHVDQVLGLRIVKVPGWVPAAWRKFWTLADHRNGEPPDLTSYQCETMADSLNAVARGDAVIPTGAVLARSPNDFDLRYVRITHTVGSRIAIIIRRDDERPPVRGFLTAAHQTVQRLHRLIEDATYCGG